MKYLYAKNQKTLQKEKGDKIMEKFFHILDKNVKIFILPKAIYKFSAFPKIPRILQIQKK